MKISVVIPTYKRPVLVAHTITSLHDQTLAPTEIIVVDNGPGGETAAVVREMSSAVGGLRHIVEPRLGVSFARNRGGREATGDLVAFIDDDAVASPRWLQALADAALSSPDAAALAGPIHLRWSRQRPPWLQGLESWYGHFDLGEERTAIPYPLFPFASNVAFRREAFLSLGGFPVELGPRGDRRISNEEDGLFRTVAKVGWTVLYEPGARVYHWVHAERLSRRYLLRRSFLQGQSDVLVDALFTPRPRTQRARRAALSLAGAVDAGAIALTRGREGGSMRALVAASTCLGSAVRDGGLALAMRQSVARGAEDPPRPPG